jgi:hypothetical protein
LNWDVFVTPGIPTVTSDLPPGTTQQMWSPISSTLIYGKRDAVLVDAFITVEQEGALVDWVAASAKNLRVGRNRGLSELKCTPKVNDPIAFFVLLHMNTIADTSRSPTFTFFGNPNFFFQSSGSTTPTVFTGDSWNHGDIQPEIGRTFIGIVGPSVRNLGVTHSFFSDHVDVRPTILFLSGLQDDYQHDGRVILETIDGSILPSSLHANFQTLLRLGQVYKQIEAPFGELAHDTLTVSTFALESNSTNDATYSRLESQIASWTAERDGLGEQIKATLESAEFNGESINEDQAEDIIREGQALLNQARVYSFDPEDCGV